MIYFFLMSMNKKKMMDHLIESILEINSWIWMMNKLIKKILKSTLRKKLTILFGDMEQFFFFLKKKQD